MWFAFGLWPPASQGCQRCPENARAVLCCVPPPLCACPGTAAAQAVISYGTRELSILSYSPKHLMGTMLRLVQISISYIGTMLQQLRSELQFALLIQVSVHISHCKFAHGDISMTVSLGAWDCTGSGCPCCAQPQPVSYSDEQALSGAVSWHVRQKQHYLAKGTKVCWTRQRRKLSDQSPSE